MGLRIALPTALLALVLSGCPGGGDVVINTTALPAGKVGVAYQASITAAGGAGRGYLWQVTGGAVPPGLTVAAEGTPSTSVSGTPSEAGTFDFTVEVSDVDGNFGRSSVRLVIEADGLPAKLAITTPSLPSGAVSVRYQAAIEATGGSGSGYSWSLREGALPGGLSLGEAGTPGTMISGTPAVAGAFPLTIAVADDAGSSATLQLVLQIDPEPPALFIQTAQLPPAQADSAYQATLTAEGGASSGYVWSIAEGALPAGLTLIAEGTPSTSIEGVPAVSGRFDLTVRVEDALGLSAVQGLVLVVEDGPLALPSEVLATAVAGVVYSATVAAAGGTGSGYRWEVSQGALPAGLTIAASGTPATILSGTPTSTGTFDFELTVTDDSGQTASEAFAIDVAPAVQIETAVLPEGRQGASYSATIDAAGGAGTGYRWSVAQGALPSGLTLGQGSPSAVISGTPSAWGHFDFIVRVEEPLGSSDDRALSIDLLPRPIAIVTATVPSGTALSPYSAVITTINGSGTSYAWTFEGALPPGVALDPTGTPPGTTVSGTPQLPGTYTATLTVTDPISGDSDARAFAFQIDAPPITIVTATLPPPIYGSPYSTALISAGGSGAGLVWSLLQGSLPPGLTFQQNGMITGYPIVEGPYDLTVQVRDSFGSVDTHPYTGAVARRLTILTRALPIADTGASYSASITAAGGTGTGYVWSITRGAPPSGLSLASAGSPATSLTGLTTAPGLYSFTVHVTDSGGAFASAALLLQVRQPQSSALIVGDLLIDNDNEVFLTGLTPGSTPTRISPAGAGTGDALTGLGSVQFSPDHTRAAFLGDFTNDGTISLYVVNLVPAVQAAFDVSGSIVAGGNVTGFVWSPNSQELLFRADKRAVGEFELFWVDMRGNFVAPAIRLSGPMIAGGGVTQGAYAFSPDAEKVVYQADQNVDGVDELFLVDVFFPVPPAPVRLNLPLVPNGDTDDAVIFLPDGDHVIYWAEEQTDTVNGLFMVDITGGSINGRTQLNRHGAIIDRAMLSPGGDRLLFVSDDDITNARELYLIDLTAPALRAFKVNPPFTDNAHDVGGARWSPDGRRIIYTADQDTEGQDELYVVDADGFLIGAPERVNAEFPQSFTSVDSDPIEGFGWSPDGTRAAFLADTTNDGAFELWLADLTVHPPAATRLSPALPAFADVQQFLFAPDSNRLVYHADQTVDGQDELFYVDLSGAIPGPPQQVNPPLPAGGDVTSTLDDLRWSRSSQTIYYRADQVVDNAFEAYGVSFTGGAPGAPFMLHGLLPTNGDVLLLDVQH